MSEHALPEQRTEMPTTRRMNQLRNEGKIFVSTDLNQALTLLTGFLILQYVWSWIFADMQLVFQYCFNLIERREPFSPQEILERLADIFFMSAPPVLLLVGCVAFVGFLITMLQTDWNVKEKKIHFQFFMINPIAGIKRIFSIQGLFNTLKAIAKLAILLPLAFFALKPYAPEMVKLVHLQLMDVFHFTWYLLSEVFWKVFYILFFLAIIDYFWGKFQWLKQVKMTKDEVRDEAKATEGDEASRRRIQSKGMQRAMQRLQKSVPRADVIITNPTHFAVALQYDRATMKAPTVVAKGADFLALRIREIAKEHNVPIVERKALARALYDSARVGAEIPYALFKAVAEVLAYVYRIKGRKVSAKSSAGSTQKAAQVREAR